MSRGSRQASTSASSVTEPAYEKESTRLIERILRKLDQEKRAGRYLVDVEDYIQRAFRYTGIHPTVLQQMKHADVIVRDIQLIDRGVIHNELMNFYFVKKKLPTTYDLFDALLGKIPPYIDIGSFKKILIKMDYVWKKVVNKTDPNNTYSLVVVERPSVWFERYQYLKKLSELRKRRHVFFVDESAIHENGLYDLNQSLENDVVQSIKPAQTRFIYAVSSAGVHFKKEVSSFSPSVFERWVLNDLRELNIPSVFVLSKHHVHRGIVASPPTAYSMKSEMIDWLHQNSIPCSETMSKSELYTLVNKYTNLDTVYKVENILKMRGHEVLWIPDCVNMLSPAILLHEILRKNMHRYRNHETKSCDGDDVLNTVIELVPMTDFKMFDEYIIKEEQELLSHDIKLDEILDDLVEEAGSGMAVDVEVTPTDDDSDLPAFSDSE